MVMMMMVQQCVIVVSYSSGYLCKTEYKTTALVMGRFEVIWNKTNGCSNFRSTANREGDDELAFNLDRIGSNARSLSIVNANGVLSITTEKLPTASDR